METDRIKNAERTIAEYLRYKEHATLPDYWHTTEGWVCLLQFGNDWNWLMKAIINVQKTYPYKLIGNKYNIEEQCVSLANFIEQINKVANEYKN